MKLKELNGDISKSKLMLLCEALKQGQCIQIIYTPVSDTQVVQSLHIASAQMGKRHASNLSLARRNSSGPLQSHQRNQAIQPR